MYDIESVAPQQDGYGNLYTLVSQETRLLQVSPSGDDVRHSVSVAAATPFLHPSSGAISTLSRNS